MDCSLPGSSVHPQLPELAQTHVHRVNDAIQPSHPLSSPSPSALSFPASGSFTMSQLFASGQNLGQRVSGWEWVGEGGGFYLYLPDALHYSSSQCCFQLEEMFEVRGRGYRVEIYKWEGGMGYHWLMLSGRFQFWTQGHLLWVGFESPEHIVFVLKALESHLESFFLKPTPGLPTPD